MKIWYNKDIRFFLYIGLILIGLSTLLLSLNLEDKIYRYQIGDIAKENIAANRDIYFKKTAEYNVKKKRISESIPVVFDRDKSILFERLKRVDFLFDAITDTLNDNPAFGTDDFTFQRLALKSHKYKNYVKYKESTIQSLFEYPDKNKFKKIIRKILIYIYDNKAGILKQPYENILNLKSSAVIIRNIANIGDGDEVTRNIEDIDTLKKVRLRVYNITYSIAPKMNKSSIRAIVDIVKSNVKPNLKFNFDETNRRLKESIEKIKYPRGLFKKNQIIIRKGDTVTTEILNKITILNQNAKKSNISYILGLILIQLSFLSIFAFFILKFKDSFILGKNSSIVVFTIIFAYMFYSFILIRSGAVSISSPFFIFFFPIAFVTMILSILYNIYLAMLVGVYVVFFTIMIGGGDISTIILAFNSAIIGVFVNANVERRTDFLRGGFIIGLLNSVLVIAIILIKNIPFDNIIYYIEMAIANGLINSILVLGIFPLYEAVFGITTRFKLLELSDLNSEIFKDMLVNAPGTYNHTLFVSTMAENACKDIGANSMLARVGAYYHDIGKISDSGIFIENKVTDRRAERMTSEEYAKLIISHVDKGVVLAKQNRLPESIIDFVKEHHGTSMVTYFYHQALEELDKSGAGNEVVKTNFQYKGPKPHNREIAVVMLADSIEAASRALTEPTSEKMEAMIKEIVFNKISSGELDHSDLSMSDLTKIQIAFLRILNGIFHTRIEYPDKEDLENLEDKAKNNGNLIEDDNGKDGNGKNGS